MGSGRADAMSNSARPPGIEPVNEPAFTLGSLSAADPLAVPVMTANEPAGAPAPDNAALTISPVRTDSAGCPECAFRITGQPAASADAVSPPATLNANGKLLAANTTTGPSGTSIRRRSGRGPIPHDGSAWSMVAS